MSGTCPQPVSDETLISWWAGELPALAAGGVERHLLSCGTCAVRAEGLAEVAGGVRSLVREGELAGVLLPGVVERLKGEGRRVREYHATPGEAVQCSVAPDDDVVLARLKADLGRATRLDLTVRIDDGPEQRLDDLPFDPSSGEMILATSIGVLRRMPAHVQTFRLLAVAPDGDHLLGEYMFDHTPWPDRSGP